MAEPHDGRPLFEHYPGLRPGLPLVRLAELPTPVRRLSKIEARTYVAELWLKDDGPSSPFYGGNKVRKLELLLAAARAAQARTVMTFGYAGSNHATATAVHASRLGMRSLSMLLPQLNAAYLRNNLLVSAAVGAEVREYSSKLALYLGSAWTLWQLKRREGKSPFVVPPGGSSPLGTVGFVNAAFELADQIEEGLLPLPKRIYVAAGSLGTAVGLGIGLAALRLDSKIVAVRVVDSKYVSASKAKSLWTKTVALLKKADPSFPDVGHAVERLEIRDEFFGGCYARPTAESTEARRLASRLEGLDLDVTYTSKALACVLADAREGKTKGGPVLFWNTCNSSDLTDLAAEAQPVDLPRRLQRYFELDESFTET
ncbi:MAG: 1-aminocyclopropane-1-carboxylate deaminase/D-cysteine desulfhydrase [Candidatus Binatia bacterium]